MQQHRMEIEERMWRPPLGKPHFKAFQLQHQDACIVVVPERGGKIVSLRHLASGKEWLWLNSRLPWTPASPEESYTAQHDVGGWDECFPTIAPTIVGDQRWPDHGDLWWRSWDVAPAEQALWMGVETSIYHFERVIRPAPGGFHFQYTLHNRTGKRLPYLWCAHPLICIDPPLSIEIPGRPRLRLGNRSRLGRPGNEHRWPLVRGRSFEQVGKPSGLAAKLLLWMERGEVTLRDRGSAVLRLRWSVDQLPILGLWLNEEGWSGTTLPPYCNLGVEPANGAPDDLKVALQEWQCARLLEPHESHKWWLDVTLSTTKATGRYNPFK